MKTVFVTGGTGFLGGALIHALSAQGIQIKALVRNPQKGEKIAHLAGVELIQGDLTTDTAWMDTALNGVDVVFHVAAALGGDMAQQRAINVDATRALALASAKAGVGRFVHVSSIAVYGYPSAKIIAEEHPLTKPIPYDYAVTKGEGETALIDVASVHNLPYSIIRPGMIYGAHSQTWTKLAFNIAKRKPTIFIGNGSGKSAPIYVDDVVNLLILSATHHQAIGQIFNGTPDPAPTWREFLGSYSALVGGRHWLSIPTPLIKLFIRIISPFTKLDMIKGGTGFLKFITSDTTYSTQKARDLLGWSPKIPLDEGIKRCIPYLKEKGLLE
ncbi:MAG: NAD(P)-dependent oxidoreductase [Phototrophicales bacterium]|nr:NAD(P)-dependent oxidoreductase [Phototrophicales bacterium]